MKIRIKVHEYEGKPWMVLGGYSRPGREHIVTVILAGENDSDLTLVMTQEEFNTIPYRWFEDTGPAPKGNPVEGEPVPR